MTEYNIVTDTFWTLGSSQGTEDGSSYANRKAFPTDITGLTVTPTAVLYIVRETENKIISATGTIQVINWVTITGDAVGGVYPDDDTVTYKLALDGIGNLYLTSGNVSYLHLGFSDFVGTVSRTASAHTYIGSIDPESLIQLFMLNCSFGMASGHYKIHQLSGYYAKNCIFKKDDYTWWSDSSNSADDNMGVAIWDNCTFTLYANAFWLTSYSSPLAVIIIGSLTLTNTPHASSVPFTNCVKVRSINIIIKDSGGDPIDGVFVSIFYKGGEGNIGKLPSDFFTKRMTDSSGRPKADTSIFGLYQEVENSQNRNELRAFLVVYSRGNVDENGYNEETAYDPEVDIIVTNETGITIDNQAMDEDYGSLSSPEEITLSPILQTISNQAHNVADPYNLDFGENITVTADYTGSDDIWCEINGKYFLMTNTAGSCSATINSSLIGVCSNQTVKVHGPGAPSQNCDNPITVNQPSNMSGVASWFTEQVDIENKSGLNDNAESTFGDPTTVSCKINHKKIWVKTPLGGEVYSQTQILVPGNTTVDAEDRVTMPDGSTALVKNVQDQYGPNGTIWYKTVFT